MILRETSGKNSDSEKNYPISRTSSLCSCGSGGGKQLPIHSLK